MADWVFDASVTSLSFSPVTPIFVTCAVLGIGDATLVEMFELIPRLRLLRQQTGWRQTARGERSQASTALYRPRSALSRLWLAHLASSQLPSSQSRGAGTAGG